MNSEQLVDAMMAEALEAADHEAASEIADQIIWKPVLREYPQAKTGDMDIGLAIDLYRFIQDLQTQPITDQLLAEVKGAIARALDNWIELNVPDSDATIPDGCTHSGAGDVCESCGQTMLDANEENGIRRTE